MRATRARVCTRESALKDGKKIDGFGMVWLPNISSLDTFTLLRRVCCWC